MRYCVDKIMNKFIVGWCFDENNKHLPVMIELYLNGEKIAEKIADIYREGLKNEGIHPSGYAGFIFKLKEKTITPQTKIELKIKDKKYFLSFKNAYINFLNISLMSRLFRDFSYEKKDLCIIHIGMHKTGTSSIQHNLNQLKSKNFRYFNLGSENHSIPLYSLFSSKRYNYHVHIKQGRSLKDVYNYSIGIDKRIRDNISNNMTQNIFVLSAEDIINLTLEELEFMKKYLEKFFHKIKIVAYVRSPFSYTTSAVQQTIKSGLTVLDQGIQNQYPKYKSKFQKYDRVFGKQNVLLNYFSKNNLIEDDITIDFLKRNSLEVSEKSFLTTNESLTLESVSLLYIYNKFGSKPVFSRDGNLAKAKLINILSQIGNRKFTISKKILDKLFHQNKEDLDWIENRMQMKLSDKSSYIETKNAILSEEDLYEAAKIVIYDLEKLIYKEKNFKNLIIDDTPQSIAKLIDNLYQKIYKDGARLETV